MMRNPPMPESMYRFSEPRRLVNNHWTRDADLLTPLQRKYVHDCAETGDKFHRAIFDMLGEK